MSSTENNKKYYLKHKDKVLAANNKWNHTHKDRIKELAKIWELNNKDRRRDINLKYTRSEKGKLTCLFKIQKYRGLFKSIVHNFSKDDWINKVNKTNGICSGYNRPPHYVGCNNLTLDHIIPLSKTNPNQVYTIHDVHPLCQSCNSMKSNKI